MYISPTLTAEEFKTVHNALCDIDSVAQNLEGVLDSKLYSKLVQARDNIRKAFANAYDQDNKSFGDKSDHYKDVAEQLGLKDSVWSIYEVNNMVDRHPFEGADRIVYRDHWGKRPVSSSVHGSTWAALFVAANACIHDSGDSHHIFIERFTPDKDDPRTLILQTGS